MRVGSRTRLFATSWRLGGVAVALVASVVWLVPDTDGQGVVDLRDGAVQYTLSLPEPEHRWMRVEVQFTELEPAPLSVRMSSASPGRYARHDFAKNVFDLRASTGAGQELAIDRPTVSRWDVANHDGTVVFSYRIFGDMVDGTYLAIDATHAHLNMPASLVWGAGLEDRPAVVRFEPPEDREWRVATQLYPTTDPLTFQAPNLAYLLDSPAEFSDFEDRTFTVTDPGDPDHVPTFRVALHHTGTDRELDRYAADVEQIVREMVMVFGEFPRFETGRYTFIADYLPGAGSDAMEHRNSTVVSSPAALRMQGRQLLGSVSHEFFHVWNVERIRPQSLEPFDYERVNPSGELWLAEGFTNYYGALVLQRAGLAELDGTLRRFGVAMDTVELGPGRRFRSAVEMSRLAPFTDAATAIDPTNWENLFISYYTWGETLGLALDLSLRARSAGPDGVPAVTLDDYMRLMWERFGRPGGASPGAVDRPYTMADARAALADLTRDSAFADEFFDRYVEGHETVDYEPLLARAGIAVIPRAPGQAWLGSPSLRFDQGGARVVAPVGFDSPLYEAGVARADLLVTIDGRPVSSARALRDVLARLTPGQPVPMTFARGGVSQDTRITPTADPSSRLVAFEDLDRVLTPAQRRFREAWLGPQSPD